MRWIVTNCHRDEVSIINCNNYIKVYDWAVAKWNGETFSIYLLEDFDEITID